jgi:hypothetical protein
MSPYSFPNNIPRPAKHWTDSEKKKCIAASNAVLADGGSEKDAIFACIHAAGKGKKSMPKQNKALIHKDKAGQLWFIGVYSNNFEDREGEILSWDSHVEYSTWAKSKGVKPPIVIMHTPKYPDAVHLGLAIGLASNLLNSQQYNEKYLTLYQSTALAQADLIIPLNGFMFVAGKVLEGQEKRAELIQQSSFEWGMSHGFIPLKQRDNIIDQYRTFEFTVLPSAIAANELTPINFMEEKVAEDKNLTEEQREEMEKVLNPDKAEDTTEKARQMLQSLLASKELGEKKEHMEEEMMDEEKDEEEEKKTESKSYEAIRAKIFVDLDVEGLQAAFKQAADLLDKANKRIDALEAQVKKSVDEVVAEQLNPVQWTNLFNAPGLQDEKKIEDLKKALPKPKEKDKNDNPLQLGFWNQFHS